MKLFGSYTSPYVRHCRIVLARNGQDCRFVETDYEQSAELSPARRVPFLYDDKLMLTDSASILRYLREKAGQPFFPDIRDYDLFLLVNTAMDILQKWQDVGPPFMCMSCDYKKANHLTPGVC